MGLIRVDNNLTLADINNATNKLTGAAKQSVSSMENKIYLAQLEKELSKDLAWDIKSVTNTIDLLKNSSIFNSKTVTFSDQSVIAAPITDKANTGEYSVEVLTLAQPSYMKSTFTSLSLSSSSAGVSDISGINNLYNQMAGVYSTTIGRNALDTLSYAATQFTADSDQQIIKYSASISMSRTVIDGNGNIIENLQGCIQFSMDSIALEPIDVDMLAGSNINAYMYEISNTLNDSINEYKGTMRMQYVAMQADYNLENGDWSAAVYDVSGENLALSVKNSYDSLPIALGFGELMRSEQTDVISMYQIANTHEELQQQLSSSLIYGSTLSFESTGLMDGIFEIKQSSSLAGKFSITDMLSNIDFAQPFESGIFSINDIPIYVNKNDDTLQDLINKVNSSAAGVTLRLDNASEKFIITSDTSAMIKFGGADDTSSFLQSAGFMLVYDQLGEYGVRGNDTTLSVDGQEYRREGTEFDDIIQGVTISAKSIGSSVLKIENDTDGAVTAMANFVKSYNSFMIKYQPGAVSAYDRENKMQPLTQTQKNTMSKANIEKYEQEYNVLHAIDLLHSSTNFLSLSLSLQKDLVSPRAMTGSIFNSLGDIGITAAGNNCMMVQSSDITVIKQSILGNAKIMENLNKHSDDVYNFFNQYSGRPATLQATQNTASKLNIDKSADADINKAWQMIKSMESRTIAIQIQNQYLSMIQERMLEKQSKP